MKKQNDVVSEADARSALAIVRAYQSDAKGVTYKDAMKAMAIVNRYTRQREAAVRAKAKRLGIKLLD